MLSRLLRRFLSWLAPRLPCRVIGRDEEYLLRYYVCGGPPEHFPVTIRPRLSFLPTVFLHRFVRSDWDRELHNHPWDRSVSLILAGGYVEERRVGAGPRIEVRRFGPGSINRLDADTFHRVDLLGEDCWTLFVCGSKVGTWGFYDRYTGEYIGWREHLARDWAKTGTLQVRAAEREDA